MATRNHGAPFVPTLWKPIAEGSLCPHGPELVVKVLLYLEEDFKHSPIALADVIRFDELNLRACVSGECLGFVAPFLLDRKINLFAYTRIFLVFDICGPVILYGHGDGLAGHRGKVVVSPSRILCN